MSQRRELSGRPDTDLFVVVPYRFAPWVDDMRFGALPIITDEIDLPVVRAYRRL